MMTEKEKRDAIGPGSGRIAENELLTYEDWSNYWEEHRERNPSDIYLFQKLIRYLRKERDFSEFLEMGDFNRMTSHLAALEQIEGMRSRVNSEIESMMKEDGFTSDKKYWEERVLEYIQNMRRYIPLEPPGY